MKDYTFSKYIVTLREKHGLSRFDLARRLRIGYVTVAKWENAETIPTREELEKLSDLFNLSVSAIRAHSFVELPGCSVKPRTVKSAPVAEPTPAEEAPTIAEIAPIPAAKPIEPIAPVAEPVVPIIAPVSEPTEPVAPVAEPVAPVETAEPIASTAPDYPPIDFSAIRNPEAEDFYKKKMTESKNEQIVSSHKRFGVRIRRFLGIIIDQMVAIALSVALAFGVIFFLPIADVDLLTTIAMCTAFLGDAVLLALRDAIAGGTSLGKRIFGLCVVDKVNAARPVVWQRVVRSLSHVIIPVPDAIVVLATGRSIGDFIAGTAVVSRKDYNNRLAEKNPLDPPVKVRKNRTGLTAFLILAAMALVVAFFAGVVYITTVMLENERQTEEYLYAYDAIIESDEFASIDADESELLFTSFYRRTELGPNGSVTVIEYTFETDDYFIYVTVESSIDGIAVTDIEVESIYAFE